MPKRDKPSRKKSFLVISLFFLIAIGVFFIITWSSKQQQRENIDINHDKLEFVTVENTDPKKYIAIISPVKAVDILVVSKYFYKYEEYWSYIYRDNKLDNLLNIPAGAIIQIPKIDSIGSKNSLAKAKLLGEELLQKQFSRKDE